MFVLFIGGLMQEVVALRLIIRDGEYKFDRFEIFAVV